MRTSIATVCLSGTLDEKLAACAAAGFDGVEIFEPDLVVSPHTPAQIRRRCTDLGLTIDLYQPFRDIEGTEPEVFRDSLRRFRAKTGLMRELGADTVLVCSNVATATIGDEDLLVEQLHELAEVAQAEGVKVAYEALAWGRFVSTYDHAWRLVERADHPALGTCLDSFHILSRGSDPAGIEDIPGEKIFFLQLADAPALHMDVLSWSRHHRLFPGQGAWDMPGFLAHVMRAGYTGPVSLEIFNDTFRQADVERTAVDARRSLRWLEERTASLVENPPQRLVTLPRVTDPTGLNFAEIKAGDAAPVEGLLRSLGFVDHGHHRTKPVTLWTQGAARVVVNGQDAEGVEPTVAALGFTVEDPIVAMSRASQLGTAAVPRATHADEEVLQGVVAPDGLEVFFCRERPDGTSAWMSEFESRPSADDGIGITHVDHVNLAEPWQHYDEAVLFLASVLSLDPQPSLDVASPVGLVRSQSVRSTDGAVRLALNVAPPIAAESAHGCVLRAQHVAFACDDIVSVARACRERGLAPLPVPDNYYADLAARFDLPAERLAELRDLHLLYDRVGDGEFLHFYTRTVGEVFLEVVERREGYDGYGAPNAPVRHAIQFADLDEENR